MKYKIIAITGLALVAMMAFASFAAAEVIYGDVPYNFANGKHWVVSGLLADVSAIKMESIVGYYSIVGQPDTPIIPKQIQIDTKNNQLTLIFDQADLPSSADSSRVEAELVNGDTFYASGPGFAFARTR